MPTDRLLVRLYLLNASVLLAHEIDAAYWHEWELFGIPGGVQVFVLLNLPLLALVFYGLQVLAQGQAAGLVFSWLLVTSGFLAVGLHAYFFVQGDEAFMLPVSLGLLGATGVLSLVQALGLLRPRGQRYTRTAQPAESVS